MSGGNLRRRGAGLGIVMTAAASLAAAVPATVAAQTAPQAQQADTVAFDIPAQPLADALVRFGQQSGLQVSADNTALGGLRSNPVAGALTPAEALRRLLAGTGVSYYFSGANAVTIAASANDGAGVTTLGPVTVEGQAETPYSHVDGYVATRTATGSKTNTPIMEVPQSISVVTSDAIEARGSDNVGKALYYAPGVFAESSGVQRDGDSLSMRGFQGGSFQESFYVDGLAGPNVTPVESYSLERIELLRGPASVLYGEGQPGGIVNMVTKRPMEMAFGEVSVQGGSFERKQGTFDVGGPATEDGTWLYRLTGLARHSETQIDFSEDHRVYVLGSVTWQPTADTHVTAHAEFQKDYYRFNFGLPAQGTALPNPNGDIPITRFIGEPDFDDNEQERESLGYKAEHRFNEAWAARQNFRYTHEHEDRFEITPQGLQADLRTLNRGTFVRENFIHGVSVDNQLEFHTVNGPFEQTILAGLDHQWESILQFQGAGAAPAIDIFAPVYGAAVAEPARGNTKQTTRQTGVYVQDQIKLFDHWIVTLGGRHDWAKSVTDNRATGIETTQNDRALTMRGGLGYKFDFGLTPYVSYAESFLPVSGTDVGGNPFVPETSVQYEVGAKFQPDGWNSFLAISLYDLRRQNVRTADPANPGFSVQTGEVTSRGIEVEAVASLDNGLNLTAAYAYNDVEVTKSNGTDLGKRPIRTPDHLASLWADYTLPSGELSGLNLGAGVRFVGDSPGDSANTFDAPDYTLVDARLGYVFGDVELAVNVTNLLNTEYVAACFFIGQCNVGQARSVFGTLTYNW